MKNKGFTLIELLAVIILIGLIALITVPKINESISDSKQKIAEASAVNYSKQIDKLVLEEKMKNNSILLDGDYNIDSNGNIYNEENEYVIDVSGKKPTGGTLTFSENDLQSGCITVNKYAVTIVNGEVANITKGNCEYQNIEDNIIAIAQNYANSVKTAKGNLTNIFDVPVEGVTSNKVTAGWVALVEGEIDSYSLKIGAYVVTFLNGNTTISKTTEITSKASAEQNIITYKTNQLGGEEKNDGATYIRNALEVYYNPITGAKDCNGQEGCMHWYLYSVKNDYANMLLDHNITEEQSQTGVWALETDYKAGLNEIKDENQNVIGYQTTEGTNSKAVSAGITYPNTVTFFPVFGADSGQSKIDRGPVTALNTLKSLTSGWARTQTPKIPNSSSTDEHIIPASANNNKYIINYSGYQARLITKEETGYLGCTTGLYTCPDWMKDNIYNNTYPYGYWTSSYNTNSSNTVWYVEVFTSLMSDHADYIHYGIRPVITVNINDIL